ncbi:MAG TPA: hypothetical protein PLM89_00455 [Anaerolineales bacterium]|nr:hypothetical protein [Anaerolineales bacterium]
MKKLLHPLLLIIFVSTLIGAGMLRRGHEWGDDWAWYVLQAKSIVDGSLDEFIEISALRITNPHRISDRSPTHGATR